MPTPGDSRVVAPLLEARLQLRLWAPAPQEHSPALVQVPAPRLVGRWSPTSHRPGCPAPGVQLQEEVSLKDKQGRELPPNSAFKQSPNAVIVKARVQVDAWPPGPEQRTEVESRLQLAAGTSELRFPVPMLTWGWGWGWAEGRGGLGH